MTPGELAEPSAHGMERFYHDFVSIPKGMADRARRFPSREPTVGACIAAIEDRTPLRHRSRHCGNGDTILRGATAPSGSSSARRRTRRARHPAGAPHPGVAASPLLSWCCPGGTARRARSPGDAISHQLWGKAMRITFVVGLLCLLAPHCRALAQESKPASVADPALAKKLGADERGMRNYVLVILKTGPKRVPAGAARDEMFRVHFANMKRLADQGKLVVAGPFADENDWRGMFLFAVETTEEAGTLVATDPVIKSGEMVAEYHRLYCSAALMAVKEVHEKIAPK
ncbi:hypothetical protein OJF2_78040 [Aquisphaera giovannonii]|uniref:YCII-related domain-containing protein n=1 Tax=Aquisphaera giovannonii TaxID=406548 RepID=A0A5B9WF32_9BACT|nr:YciI family protein [Aquisphaera giovannonii]QEH39192.1 hypothetical protein OJF2_78040 [Aquisphaera giovannonii]